MYFSALNLSSGMFIGMESAANTEVYVNSVVQIVLWPKPVVAIRHLQVTIMAVHIALLLLISISVMDCLIFYHLCDNKSSALLQHCRKLSLFVFLFQCTQMTFYHLLKTNCEGL